jgi:hypothetical protein
MGLRFLFIVALSFFTLSLVDLVREARISLHYIGPSVGTNGRADRLDDPCHTL